MFYDVHIDKQGNLLSNMPKYLRRHDIVYHSPAYEKYNGLPVGEGDIAGLYGISPDSMTFYANKSDLFDDRSDTDFSAWGVEWEEKVTVQTGGGTITVSDGMPSWDTMYLKSFEKRLNLGAGRLELSSETPFSSWTGQMYGSHPDHVMVFNYHTTSVFPVERSVSLQKWGSRVSAHYYELRLNDPSIRLNGTQSYLKDGCALIRVELSKMFYILAAKVVADHAKWDLKNPHEAYCTLEKSTDCTFSVILTIVNSEESTDPEREALNRLHTASCDIPGTAERAARDWNSFISKSFVHLTNEYLENCWYMTLWQMYISFRGRYPAAFNGGSFIWNRDTRNWGYTYHWNGQIPYWGVQSANHPELFEPYAAYRRGMLDNACRGAQQLGYEGAFYADISDRNGYQAFEPDICSNLTCGPQIAMHLFRQWEYTRDDVYLTETVLPVMYETARFYLSYLEFDETDGLWHIECATIYENYLAFRDSVTDRVYIESLFRAILSAEEYLGETSELSDRLRDVLEHLYPYTFIEHEGKTVFTCGILGSGEPMEFRKCGYPEGIGMIGELSALFPGAEYCRARHEYPDILKNTYEASLRNRPFNCGHTPYGVSAAHLGLPVTDLLLGVIEAVQIFPSGLSHFMDFRADMEHKNVYSPHVLDGTETNTAWAKLHEKSEYTRYDLPRHDFMHPYLETMGHILAAVNDSLLDSRDGKIRVFPCEQPDGLIAFKLLARGGCVITSEKNDDVRYIVLEAVHAGDFTVVIPWKSQTCIYRNGKAVRYTDSTEELTVTLECGERCILCPRSRRLEVMYNSYFEDDVINNAVKHNGRAQLGMERRY